MRLIRRFCDRRVKDSRDRRGAGFEICARVEAVGGIEGPVRVAWPVSGLRSDLPKMLGRVGEVAAVIVIIVFGDASFSPAVIGQGFS